ncbi:MAG: RsmB/NOP family class I SAM-dependent RNA methyltransferase [Waddliaceae bacterium]
MKKRPFREHHLFELLTAYDKGSLPLDRCISVYFRANKALGSKDRAVITDTIYGMIRWQGLLDYLSPKPVNWETRYAMYKQVNPPDYQNREDIPPFIRLSFPKELYELIADSHGPEKAQELCLISNQPAPATVRINTIKITRKEMLERWQHLYEIFPCPLAKEGIVFHKKINFYALAEFKEGLFEVQDEGSQLLASLVDVKPGQQVLDYCAGSGGKTLAFAPNMHKTGQVYLHDVRPYILTEAGRRLRRAGIHNVQTVVPGHRKLKKLKKRMDWVLVDAPCTGTGTLRRNPDMKWKFTLEMLARLRGQQRMIFENALSYVRPGGKIVYATCSLLKAENQEQIQHFLRTYPLQQEGKYWQSLPTKKGMDGFFGSVLHLG